MKPGELRSRVERYVALRRAIGFEMRAEESLLRNFVAFIEQHGLDGPVHAAWAVDWACSTPSSHGVVARARRLSVVRGFLTHLHAAVPGVEVPAHGLLASARRRAPYIYAADEIDALLAVARALGPRGALRPSTYSTLIGLLASTGLRIGEAVRLRIEDVRLDEQPARLIVQEAKFHKSRLVPLHPTTADALRTYAHERRRLGYDGLADTFFVSERPGPLYAQRARVTFVALARRVGLRPSAGPGPRLHDLRHTFAVQRLLAWYREGADVHARLPELSVYLGHVRPEDSYWYLTATPELLGTAAERFDAYANAGGAK
ncbi:MAG TPA: tyrosine-type recombinase/integrase [Burkholderiales bacterium]|nr:tyrosine-type recombinase/integrase [Burkholderiales bacterium]